MNETGKKEKIIGITILAIIIIFTIIWKSTTNNTNQSDSPKLKVVIGAIGGGKENLLADPDFIEILEKKYNLDFLNDQWSNGKMIIDPLKRPNSGINYDFAFFSDQRFYDYYKNAPDKSKGEADRYRVTSGGLTLNTPIVIYSWDTVTDALIKEGIVTKTNDVYYITDMNKLLEYILEGKKWNDLGVDVYGKINIDSTDPVTSSPGATYYGLLLSIMNQKDVTEENIQEILPKLKEFYIKSGYMNNTPADLFEMYLKTGVGAKPMIVDYEKSIIDFANSNPEGYETVKDKIRILYPTPTIWNSHCLASFNETGDKIVKAFNDKEISSLAWEKYGFRTGVTGGNYDVSKVKVKGIPQTVDSVVPGLKINIYDLLINHLKTK
jgi:hypothetical protein